MRFRWKLLILLIAIAPVPLLVMRTFGVHGLHSAYPAHGDLPAGYDPREQFWYQEAFKLKTPWVDQFIDPETGQKVVAAVKTVKRPDDITLMIIKVELAGP